MYVVEVILHVHMYIYIYYIYIYIIYIYIHVGRSESKESFAIQRYLLIIGKKQNMQVLSHTFNYFST